MLCRYYNWRQDTLSDLLVVTGMSLLLLCSAAVVKHTWLHAHDGHGVAAAAAEALPGQSMTTLASRRAASVAAAPGAAAAPALAAAAAVGGTQAAGSSDLVLGPSSDAGGGTPAYEAAAAGSLWDDVYRVLILSFGESFPPADGESGLVVPGTVAGRVRVDQPKRDWPFQSRRLA